MLKNPEMTEKDPQPHDLRRRKIAIFGRKISMPNSRPLRIAIGILLILFGILGFLPVLGFWMIPLGLLILSHDFAVVRRLRRRLVIWWERRQRGNP
jgi:hypothetical protein